MNIQKWIAEIFILLLQFWNKTFATLLIVEICPNCYSVMAKFVNCRSLSCFNSLNHLDLVSGLNLFGTDLSFVVTTSELLFVGSLKAISAFEVCHFVCLWLAHYSLLVGDNSTSWVLRKFRILRHFIWFLVYYL